MHIVNGRKIYPPQPFGRSKASIHKPRLYCIDGEYFIRWFSSCRGSMIHGYGSTPEEANADMRRNRSRVNRMLDEAMDDDDHIYNKMVSAYDAKYNPPREHWWQFWRNKK